MTIVLYDTEHFETLETQVRILDNGAHRLLVLVPDSLRLQLQASGIHPSPSVHFETLPDKSAAHPDAVYRSCRREKADLLLLCTVSFQHWLFARACRRLRPLRVLLGVHDVNDLFAPKKSWGLRGLIRYVGRRRLAEAAAGYIVLLEEMKRYLRARYSVSKPVYVVPGSCYTPSPPPSLEGPVRVLVPGSIDPRRRSYEQVRHLVRAIFPEDVAVVRIVGGSDPNWRPSWFQEYAGTLEVTTGAFVDVATYEQALAGAELVWAPLPATFQRPGHPDEHYGQSKSSGTFFDALRHGKPLLLPDGIPVPELLATVTLCYIDHEHLHYLLLALRDNPAARERLQLMARANAERYTLDAVRTRLLPSLTAGA